MKTEEITLEQAALAWAQGKRVEARPAFRNGGPWNAIASVGSKESSSWPASVLNEAEVYKFRLAPEPPAVGTADWANSLPEGTKIRCNMGAWTAGRFTEKRNGVWSKWSEYAYTPDDKKDGWELYQDPPAKKFRPWTPEEVPVGAVMRWKTTPTHASLICSHGDSCVFPAGATHGTPFEDALTNWVYSLDTVGTPDSKRTWLPCGVEVSE